MRLTLWQWFWVGTIVVVAAMILLATAWFHSTADLRRVQAYAKAAGVGTTWEEAAFPAPTAAEQRLIADITRLAGLQKSLRSTDYLKAPRQIEPANAALREHYAQIPENYWRELDSVIDGLPAVPGCAYDRIPITHMELIQQQRELARLQSERLQCCPIAELHLHLARMNRLCHLFRNQTLIQQIIDVSCVAIVSSAVTSRRAEMTDPELRQSVAELLRQLNQTMWDARQDAYRGEIPSMFLLYADPQKAAQLLGMSSSGSWWTDFQDHLRIASRILLIRLNRDLDLRHLVDLQIATSAAKDSADLIRMGLKILNPTPRGAWLAELTDVPSFMFISYHDWFRSSLGKQQLTLEVLIADLSNAPLPVDCFSPTGSALLPIERHGQIIGWYSVGPDGKDDGGKPGKDWGIPLSGNLGKVHFADDPEPLPVSTSSP
jgi:hypothetical protein